MPEDCWDVLLLNDDVTPMGFVIFVLEAVFDFHNSQAVALMYRIHTDGQGICGTYSREQAEQKVAKVLALAAAAHHPLKCLLQTAAKPPQSN